MRSHMRGWLISAAVAATVAPAGVAGASGGESASALGLVEVAPIRVPIIDSGRITGDLNLKLMLRPAANASGAHGKGEGDKAPAVRAALVSAALEFARLYASPFRAVDAGQLSAQLTAAAHGADPSVEQVLLIEISAAPTS